MEQKPCNFRSIFPVHKTNSHPNLYRSNAIDDGTIESAQWLRETIGINSYVDLREQNEFHVTSKLDNFFIQTKTNGPMIKSHGNFGRRYHVRFITVAYHLNLLIHKLKLNQICVILFLMIQHLFYRNYAYQKYGGQCYLSTLSLGEFYSTLLDDCQTVFKQIFTIMLDPSNFPMIICCSFGKDRTGIVSALIMKLAGCDDEEIITEYTKSEENLSSLKDEIRNFFELKGAGEEYCRTPRSAMTTMLEHLKEKYGSVDNYLKCCGFNQDQIEQIKINVMK